MHSSDDPSPDDQWSSWLLRGRSGGSGDREKAVRSAIGLFVDRVLDAARLTPNGTIVDVGTGDGAVAFRAIERVGPSLRVILTDRSLPALQRAKLEAERRGFDMQCDFVQGTAECLKGIGDSTADAVTMRAVLAYVRHKKKAFAEAYRVLKPGGWLSIAEPLMQEEAFNAIALRSMVETSDGTDRLLPLIHRWKSAQFPDSVELLTESPLTNYSERDLLLFAEEAQFVDIHMELHVNVRAVEPLSWEVFVNSSPHPLAPSLCQIMADKFTPDERQLFESSLRAVVEAGSSAATDRIVYLSARKPGAD